MLLLYFIVYRLLLLEKQHVSRSFRVSCGGDGRRGSPCDTRNSFEVSPFLAFERSSILKPITELKLSICPPCLLWDCVWIGATLELRRASMAGVGDRVVALADPTGKLDYASLQPVSKPKAKSGKSLGFD